MCGGIIAPKKEAIRSERQIKKLKAWQPKGLGFWKFDSSLLEDSDYIAAMAEKD